MQSLQIRKRRTKCQRKMWVDVKVRKMKKNHCTIRGKNLSVGEHALLQRGRDAILRFKEVLSAVAIAGPICPGSLGGWGPTKESHFFCSPHWKRISYTFQLQDIGPDQPSPALPCAIVICNYLLHYSIYSFSLYSW